MMRGGAWRGGAGLGVGGVVGMLSAEGGSAVFERPATGYSNPNTQRHILIYCLFFNVFQYQQKICQKWKSNGDGRTPAEHLFIYLFFSYFFSTSLVVLCQIVFRACHSITLSK